MTNKGFDLLTEGIDGFYKRVLEYDIIITDIQYNGTGHIEFEYGCTQDVDAGIVGTVIDDACLNSLRDYYPELADLVLEQEGC